MGYSVPETEHLKVHEMNPMIIENILLSYSKNHIVIFGFKKS